MAISTIIILTSLLLLFISSQFVEEVKAQYYNNEYESSDPIMGYQVLTTTTTTENPIDWDFTICLRTQNATLYFTTGEKALIQSINISSLNEEPLIEPFFDYKSQMKDSLKTFAFDPKNQKFVAVSKESHKMVYEFDTNKQVELLEYKNDRAIEEVAVDALTGNIYFAGNQGIGVCSEDMSLCEMLIYSKGSDDEIFNLVVHARRGALFWLQSADHHYKIQIAGMDGRNPRTFQNFYTHSFALDSENPKHEYLYIALEASVIKWNLKTMAQEGGDFLPYHVYKLFYFDCYLFFTRLEEVDYDGAIKQKYMLQFHDGWTENVKTLIETDNQINLDFLFTIGYVVESTTPKHNPCLRSKCSEDEICVLEEQQRAHARTSKCISAQSMRPTGAKKKQIGKDEKGKDLPYGWIFACIMTFMFFFVLIWHHKKRISDFLRNKLNLQNSQYFSSSSSTDRNTSMFYKVSEPDTISEMSSSIRREERDDELAPIF